MAAYVMGDNTGQEVLTAKLSVLAAEEGGVGRESFLQE